MNRYFIIPVSIFFIILCIVVFYLQFINEDWKLFAPKKILPAICNDEGNTKIISHLSDHISDRSFKDNPDNILGHQIHAVYFLPCEKEDRMFDVNLNIESSLIAINKWFVDKSNNQKIIFDRKFDDSIDVTFIRVDKTMNWFTDFTSKENTNDDVGLKIENIILSNTDIFNNFENKKFIIFFEGWEKRKSLFFDICGKSRFDGKVAIFFSSGRWKKEVGNNKKMFSCMDDSLNESKNESFGKSEETILHEILHTLGSPPKCANNLEPENKVHVNDNENDILYKRSGNIYLDYNNDDYYNHQIENCPDLANSKYLETIN